MLERNGEIAAQRWPELWAVLVASGSPADAHVSDSPDPTLVISGIHLTSAYDRAGEAAAQVAAVPVDAPAVHVYGLGLGDLPRRLLQRPGLQKLRVILLNPAVACASLGASDHSDWLQDPRVELCLARADETVCAPFAVVPSMLALAAPVAFALRDELRLTLTEPFARQHWPGRHAQFQQNMAANLALVRSDGDVASLFGTRPGSEVFVLASGPTLAQHYDWLGQHRAGKTLIAVSTALPALQRAGIVPDFAVMIDWISVHPLQPDQEESFRTVPLVYVPDIPHRTALAWPGPRLTAFLWQPRYLQWSQAPAKGCLWCSGTVTHVAIDLGRKLGAQQITLFGVDFGFPAEQTHVPGAPEPTTRPHTPYTVLNGEGETLPSSLDMVTYLRDLEHYISRYPHITFVKAGRQGAHIQGASWLS